LKPEASNDSLQQSQSESGEGLSVYEQAREVNIAKNKVTMLGIGIISEHAGDSSSPRTRKAKGTGGTTGKGGKKGQRHKTSQAPAESHSPSKSTRQQTMLQQQQISVVWGGELHCSNPLQPTTYCAYWPVDSLGLTRLMAWLGTTVLNRTAAC
jgi:hypothetical protein